MRIKISRNELIVCMILTALLGEFHFLGLWQADAVYRKAIMLAAVLAAAGLCIGNRQACSVIFRKHMHAVTYTCAVLVFVFVIQFLRFVFYSTDVSFYEYIADAGRFAYVAALIPLVYVFESKRLSRMFWKGFKAIAFAQILIGEIQDMVLRFTGINFLNGKTSWRGGRLGIMIIVPIIYIPMIAALGSLINKKSKNKLADILFLTAGVHFGIFISKNRAGFLAFFAAAAVMIFTAAGSRNRILWNTLIAVSGMAAAGYLLLGGYLHTLFSFSGGEFAASNHGHLDAIRECWAYFKQHPLLGAGFRLRWPVSYCDAGFTGLLANTGMAAVFIFLIPELTAVCRVIKITLQKKKSKEMELFKGFTVFAFFTAVTLILTDESRMMGWVVIYAYMSYILANQPRIFRRRTVKIRIGTMETEG